MFKNILVGTVGIFLVSCAQTQIISKADGNYLAHSTSSSQHYAMKSAVEDAKEHCQKMGKTFAMIKQNSHYQGMDKTAKGIVQAATILADKDSFHGPQNMDSHEDYRVELTFTCK